MNQATAQSTATVGDALNNARQLLQSRPNAAAEQARAIIKVEPGIAEAHLLLAAALRAQFRHEEAELSEREAMRVSMSDPVLTLVAQHLSANRAQEAEALLQRFLEDTPNDPEALRLLARLAMSRGRLDRAETLLWRALSLAPGFTAAKEDFDELIDRQARAYTSDGTGAPSPPDAEAEFGEAIKLNERALEKHPDNPKVWLSYGHVLRISGRHSDSVAAYRKAVELNPCFGEAWWSLADLKTASLDEADVDLMAAQLEMASVSSVDRTGIHFALGRALEDAGRHEESFRQYAAGNALKRKSIRFDATATDNYVRQCEGFSPEFFAEKSGQGHAAPDPIFIIGMPRSGSTLVEQILASHPSIEGTEELVYLGNLASLLSGGRKAGLEPSAFVDTVAALPPERLESIGGAYLWNASRHRHSNRSRFIDKMPRNWLYLPLIRLALPNAKIIDVRRNPMDCCWSNFRQLFADSGEYSYDLTELGHYYRCYVRMLAHFDAINPGAIHRVIYESLIADPEGEVRRLLDHLELPFESACLEFHKNPRAVKTSSSEQVRKPISAAGIDQWQPYEPWLGPLRSALGDVVEAYPDIPQRWRQG